MKNLLTFFLLSILSVSANSAFAQNRDIKFEKTNWKALLAKAKKENKMIFLDCYTSWCGPCKWMKTNVFNNDTVADFYNANFISAAIDMERGEGFELAKKYGINTYPSMLYVNAKGEVLHRTCGAASTKDFIENGKDALSPQKQLATYTQLFSSNPTDALIASTYFEMMENACYQCDTEAKKYLLTQQDSNLTSPINWKLIYRYADYSSRSFKYFETNKAVFSKLYNKDSVEKKLNYVYGNELYNTAKTKKKKALELLKVKFRKLKTKECERIIQHADLTLVKLPNDIIKNAIEIQDSIVGPVNVSLNHTAWFKFKIDYDTILFFDIVPNDSLDDYDFSLFQCPDKNCVSDIQTGKVKSIRSCYSYCTSKSGITGLSQYTEKTSIGAGPGPAFVSAVHIKAGEMYYLKVWSHYADLIGFTIYFYNYWPKKNPIILNKVFFESNKVILLKESLPELDKLVSKLKTKNQMKIEIRGHTDNKGDEINNQTLSEKRAETVCDYLVSKNINNNRLFYKGLGSEKPIASNDTDEGRKKIAE